MWRRIGQSVQGRSHSGEGSPCQDSHAVCVLGDGDAVTLVACVADGAGSARFSDRGSAITCGAIIECAESYFAANGGFDSLQMKDVVSWCEDVRTRIQIAADLRQCECRELATTLCAAIVTPTSSFFFQIGDGAIILGRGGVYGVVFWPQSGEYANSTNFITADEYRDRLEFLATTSRFSDVALFTDGIERLALRFETRTPHAPFFEPLFRALRATDDVEGLSEGLRKFLASDSVQIRSDDDKTLILASRQTVDVGHTA